MADCQYLVAEEGEKCFVKLKGKSNYMACQHFKDFVDSVVKDKKYEEIFIDLTDLDFIDSTNLGILAKFTEYLHDNFEKKAVIYSTNPNINQIIKSVGFFDAFTVLDQSAEKKLELKEIKTSEKLEKDQMALILLDAHKTLMKLNETNKEIFSDVVKSLSDDKDQ